MIFFRPLVILCLLANNLNALQLEKIDKDQFERAIWKKDYGKVFDLLRSVIDVNREEVLNPNCDAGGETPLHSALLSDAPQGIVEALLQAGSRIDIKIDGNGETALKLAVNRYRFCSCDNGCLKLCLSYAGQQAVHQMTEVAKCCEYEQSYSFVQHLLDADGCLLRERADYASIVTMRSSSGYSALHRAAQKDLMDIFRRLFFRGADIEQTVENDTEDAGATALILAAQVGHLEFVKRLLGLGAHINHVSKNGTTALMAAAENGHASVVIELLSAGADREMQRADGETALSRANKSILACRRHMKVFYSAVINALSQPLAVDGYTPEDCSWLIALKQQILGSLVQPVAAAESC